MDFRELAEGKDYVPHAAEDDRNKPGSYSAVILLVEQAVRSEGRENVYRKDQAVEVDIVVGAGLAEGSSLAVEELYFKDMVRRQNSMESRKRTILLVPGPRHGAAFVPASMSV